MLPRPALAALALAALLAARPAAAQEVGRIGTDWTGNDIVVEAVADPKVEGVTCHLTYFARGFLDRLMQGNWFEDPSNTSIACRRTGPLKIGKIALDRDGEEVFSERRSLLFKAIAVRRIYDRANDTLIYVSHGRELKQGSAKMAISTVPLYETGAEWEGGRPR
jgi:CreA protein